MLWGSCDDDLSGPRSPVARCLERVNEQGGREKGTIYPVFHLAIRHTTQWGWKSRGIYSYAELQLSVVIVMDFGLSLRMLSFNSNSILEGEVRDSRNRDMIATGDGGEQGSSPANNRQAKITYTGRRLE